jgi:hypothetical protein
MDTLVSRNMFDAFLKLYCWRNKLQDVGIYARLFELLEIANEEQYDRLCLSYPFECHVFKVWKDAEREFFDKHQSFSA